MTDGAPESTHQPAQRLFGSYYEPVPKSIMTGYPKAQISMLPARNDTSNDAR